MTTLNEANSQLGDDTEDVTNDSDWNSVFGDVAPAEAPQDDNIPAYEAPPVEPGTNWTGNPYGDAMAEAPSQGEQAQAFGGGVTPGQYKAPSTYATQGNAMPTGINWGSERPAVGGGGGASQDFSWVTPFNKSTGGKTGSTSGITRGSITQGGAFAKVGISRTVLPKGMKLPTFAGPTWSESEAKARGRKLAAPQMAALNQKLQQAMSRYYENPNVRRMVLRDTLQGYGIGLANVVAQSEQAGRAAYSQDYSRLYSEAVNAYNRAWNETMSQASQIQSQIPVYSSAELKNVLSGKSEYTTQV